MIRSKKKGFTLIEILVVLSILALLAVLVLVSLKKVRDRAKNTEHKENILQLNRAIRMYAEDNLGLFPNTHNAGGAFLSNDPRYPLYPGFGAGLFYSPNWIPGLAPQYISSLPKFKDDGRGISTSLASPTFTDCSTQSTTYFYVADPYGYKIIVTCPEGTADGGKFRDSYRTDAYMICEVMFRPPASGEPCTW